MRFTATSTVARVLLAGIVFACATHPVDAQSAKSGLTRLLESELARFPARTGVYVKHLTTGEEAAVNADDAFSSASVIKLTILVRAFQLVDQGKINLADRVEIRRADLRDGSGVLQYHDLGQTPTIKDLLTEMVITSDNVVVDQVAAEERSAKGRHPCMIQLGG